MEQKREPASASAARKKGKGNIESIKTRLEDEVNNFTTDNNDCNNLYLFNSTIIFYRIHPHGTTQIIYFLEKKNISIIYV